jgi:biopolymer transport protein TolR
MGMSMQGGRGRRGRAPIGDINVTPLVDVMLVLLIVFMVTAPLLATGVPIDLPQTNAPEIKVDTGEPITVSINARGEMYLGEDPITLDRLLGAVAAKAGEAGKEQRIYLRGDADADYGLIMEVMGELSGAGYARIGLVTRQREAS